MLGRAPVCAPTPTRNVAISKSHGGPRVPSFFRSRCMHNENSHARVSYMSATLRIPGIMRTRWTTIRSAFRFRCLPAVVWRLLALFPSMVSAADVWWITGSAGCTSANEHGTSSGNSLAQCAARCLAIAGNGCISFEFRTASGTTTNCQLSSSCNTLHASYLPVATWPPTDWWLFIRGTSTVVAPNYNVIQTAECTGANELGVYDVTDTLATCAARCDAVPTCISFE